MTRDELKPILLKKSAEVLDLLTKKCKGFGFGYVSKSGNFWDTVVFDAKGFMVNGKFYG